MYSTITLWHPDSGYLPEFANDRTAHIVQPSRADRYREFVNAGLVSNSASANCYVRAVDGGIEVCNSTWTTLEAAQEWVDLCSSIPFILSIKVVDESGATLISFP